MCKTVKTKYEFGNEPWLGFECVTMTPLCQRLIETSLLTASEIEWVNTYHQEILEKTRGFFEGSDDVDKKRALQWLTRETAKLDAKP